MAERFWLNHAGHSCQGCRESARDANPGANPEEAAPARPHSCVWNASRACSSWPSVAKPQRAQRIVTGWGSSASAVAQPRHRDSSLTGTARFLGRPDFAGELPDLLEREAVEPVAAVVFGDDGLRGWVAAWAADGLTTAPSPVELVAGGQLEGLAAVPAANGLTLGDAGGRSGSPSRSAPAAGRSPGSPRPRSAR